MVCGNCGTLDVVGAEKCAQCGRPLASAEQEHCESHPDRLAIAQCARCGRSLCDECDVLLEGVPYCADHASGLIQPGAQSYLNSMPVLDVTEKSAATFGQRVQAGVIDLLLMVVFAVFLYLAMWAVLSEPPSSANAGGWRAVYRLLVVLCPLGYLIYEGLAGGQTVGKSVTDIVALCEDGTPMDGGTAVARGVLSVLSFLLGGIGFWYILWDPKRRALHDLVLHTTVVQE